ncbi:hypothetical protein Tco_1567422 [Tanacetum coccineum]
MSSIDTYSTTKVFDEWVSSHRSDEIRFDVYFDGRFFMFPLKYEDETILDLRLPMSKRDIKKMFEVANLQGALDLYVRPIPQVCLVEYYFKNLDVVFESGEEVTYIYRGHEKAKNDVSTVTPPNLGRIGMLNIQGVTPPKIQQCSGIPHGVLLHNTQR